MQLHIIIPINFSATGNKGSHQLDYRIPCTGSITEIAFIHKLFASENKKFFFVLILVKEENGYK